VVLADQLRGATPQRRSAPTKNSDNGAPRESPRNRSAWAGCANGKILWRAGCVTRATASFRKPPRCGFSNVTSNANCRFSEFSPSFCASQFLDTTERERSIDWRLSLRVTEHNSSGQRDRSVAVDPRQQDQRCNSWSWCFECSPRGKSRG